MTKRSAPKLITKKRLPISIRFSLRPNYPTLQIRISVDGEEGSAFASLPDKSTLDTSGLSWNQAMQRTAGRSEADRKFNLKVDNVRSAINAVYDRQVEAGYAPTVASVKGEYQTSKPYNGLEFTKEAKFSPLGCYRAYLADLAGGAFPEKKLVETTLDKWRYGLTYLETYVAATKDSDPLSTGSADNLTLFWGKGYHRWLMQTGSMAADSATRYVNRLIEAMNHVAESGKIKSNPLATLKLSRDKTKDVHFLEPHHLERFWQLDLPGKAGVSCWWMGVIFLTGLDYPDAVRYVTDRYAYERDTPWGKQIVICRGKNQSECYIPMLPELDALLQRKPEGEAPSDWEINRDMHAVATLVGFPHRLTCKVGRKTAGANFFNLFEDIGAVSRMMGHSSVTITERYYVKTTAYTVNKAMQKRFVNPTMYQSFRQAA